MQNPQLPEEVHTTRPCPSRNVEAALAEAEALTAANGQRLTAIRRKVLELLLRSPAPAKAYDLLGRLDGEGAAKPPTIYRALNFLQDAGLAHKIESLNAYVACGHARHSHSAIFLICESCGSAEELRGAVTYDAIKEETEAAGFRTEHTVVEARGTCRACQG
ncbi:MAG: Fur family transcriptional regulator [Pseudomonadota bacterium]